MCGEGPPWAEAPFGLIAVFKGDMEISAGRSSPDPGDTRRGTGRADAGRWPIGQQGRRTRTPRPAPPGPSIPPRHAGPAAGCTRWAGRVGGPWRIRRAQHSAESDHDSPHGNPSMERRPWSTVHPFRIARTFADSDGPMILKAGVRTRPSPPARLKRGISGPTFGRRTQRTTPTPHRASPFERGVREMSASKSLV